MKIMTRNSLPALLLAAAATNSLELLEGEEDEEDSSPFRYTDGFEVLVNDSNSSLWA